MATSHADFKETSKRNLEACKSRKAAANDDLERELVFLSTESGRDTVTESVMVVA